MNIKDFIYEEEVPVGRIDSYCIFVYKEPLHNPSFHITTENGEKHCSYQIKDFKLLEKISRKSFTNKELKKIKEWLLEKNKKIPERTNWQVLIDQWNLANDGYEINRNVLMPK